MQPSLFHRLMKLNIAVFVAISVVLSEILTSLMGILLRGRITYDYLITGGFVSLIVSWIVVLMHRQVTRLSDDNVNLRIEIVNRQKAEETTRRTQQKYQAVIETTNTGFVVLDKNGAVLDANQEYVRLTGHTALDEIKGMAVTKWTAEEDRQRNAGEIKKCLELGFVRNLEIHYVDSNGLLTPIEINATAVEDADGVKIVAMCRDITERNQAEEKIRRSEQFIRKILDTVDEGFIVIDRDFRILTANKAYVNQVGGIADEIIGRRCHEVSHRTDRPCFEEGEECAVRQVFETGEPHTAIHRHTDPRGDILFVETKAFPVIDSSGVVTSVIETVNNVTEKHLLEEERLKTQKLESIGTLAGGIAHDFNNLLQGVFGYISMARITHDQKDCSLSMLEQAEQALHLSVNLATQLLTFSKGGKPVKRRIKLQPVIENSVKFALSGSIVNHRITLDDDLWPAEADEGQISQVIQNIVLNADQAMPTGGTISVNVKNVYAPSKGVPLSLAAGKYVEITIADTGIGIPGQYLPKIFDPYFTTKEKGSGLGLATSYSIIKNHGGLIDVKSELGSGTTFVVYIPAINEEENQEALSLTSAAARAGKILVMDDEEAIRNIAGIMIKSLGHEVELAENGDEAVARYREAMSSGRPFEIVILDLTIRGGKGGKETLQDLLELDPGVTAVVSSGYSEDTVVSEYRSHGFRGCLAKPYKIDTLKDTLNGLLK